MIVGENDLIYSERERQLTKKNVLVKKKKY